MEMLPIFVYGTLQRGEQREHCWPRLPRQIQWATVLGTLYDLGPHPALVAGAGTVWGELWHIAAAHLRETLEVLDEIEGFAQPGQTDWYRRTIVACQPDCGAACRAYTYHYARPAELASLPPVTANAQGICRWRAER